MQNEPIFKSILYDSWKYLPPVFHKHYANHGFSNDEVIAKGHLNLFCKWYMKPFFFIAGLPVKNQNHIPVTVKFKSEKSSAAFCFHRIFHFKKNDVYFNSKMYQYKDNEVREEMKYRINWHCNYNFDGKKIILKHNSYSLRLFGFNIKLPINFLLGKGNAWEKAIDENNFAMNLTITHPIFGKIYGYNGEFEIL